MLLYEKREDTDMGQKNAGGKEGKIKKFFARLAVKLDNKLKEKSKNSKGCCGGDSSEDRPCCK